MKTETFILAAGHSVLLSATVVDSGHVNRLADRVGGEPFCPIFVNAGETLILGPFSDTRRYVACSEQGKLSYEIKAQVVERDDSNAHAEVDAIQNWLTQMEAHPMCRFQEEFIAYLMAKNGLDVMYPDPDDRAAVVSQYRAKKDLRGRRPQ